jgi:phospholipase/carboxylesterase
MNRIAPSTLEPFQELSVASQEGPAGLDSARARRTAAGRPDLAFFAPLHYEANYAYPLLVWLHGAADDERHLKCVMPHVSTRNYAAVAPRLPKPVLDREARGAQSWSRGSAEALLSVEHRVFHAIDEASARFHIAPRRIVLVGWGRGGSLALRIALLHPEKFAGVASLGGPLPEGGRPFQCLEQARRLPLLIACGRASQGYAEPDVCRDLRLLHTAGISVTLRQYPAGDELTTNMLGDLNHWVMAQVCPSTAT